MQQEKTEIVQRPAGHPFFGEVHQDDGYYEYDCGHRNDGWVKTTTITRGCPVCRGGRLVALHKPCAACGVEMVLNPGMRTKYCPECAYRRTRASSFVNPKSSLSYTPIAEIDVDAVMEGRPDPGCDPLDIVFAKYDADPFYRFAPS